MNRFTTLLTVFALGALCGCPPPPAPDAAPQEVREAMVLKVRGQQASADSELEIGHTLDLELGFGPGEDNTLFGAMIADPGQAELTRWHSEPEGAAEFDPVTQQAVLKQAGSIKIWATWASPQGPVKSNVLEVVVGAGQAAPAGEQPQ